VTQEPPAQPPDERRKDSAGESAGDQAAAEKVPESEAPPAAPPRPATVEDLRSLRRWLLVASVWAIAATAIAVIALVVANRFDEEELNARTADQIRDVQRGLEDRIDDLGSRIGELPTSEDISDLDNRLGEVENRLGTTSDRLERLDARLDELDQRVEDLEQTETTTTQTETTETNP
jgi:septal ring factor EnvC (AmiA/AmiB activator)